MLPKRYRLKRRDFALIYSDRLKNDQKNDQSESGKSKNNQAFSKLKKSYSTQYLAKYLKLRLLKLPSYQPVTVAEKPSYHNDIDKKSPNMPSESPNSEILDNQANQQAQLKIGIVISKKVAKRAVIRNRLRRQIKAILISILPLEQEIDQDLNLVITVLPFTIQPTFSELKNDLSQLLQNSNLISPL